MDLRKIKKLIELLDESGIAEIEVTEGEESVRISRYGASPPVVQAAAPVAEGDAMLARLGWYRPRRRPRHRPAHP